MQVQQVKLSSLLEDIQVGKLIIPDFQRDFVWTKSQIEELLGSVVNRYFIGTILLLESPTSNLRFAPRMIRGVEGDLKKHPIIKYVLDGQQRITSLFYAFFEPNLPLGDDDKGLPTRFYLKIPACDELVGVEKFEHLLRRMYSDQESRKMLKTISAFLAQATGIDIEQYPTMAAFRSPESLSEYLGAHASLAPELRDKLNRLLQSILDYEIAVVTLQHDSPDEEIVNTFERINRTGTRLGIFDLAVARYYPLGLKLNEMKRKLETGAETKKVIDLLETEAILKTMAVANGTEPKNKNLLGLVDLKKDRTQAQAEFYTRWGAAVQYLQKALLRMREVYGAAELPAMKRKIALIPYTSLAVPLACMIQAAELRGGAKALYDKIDAWYWTSVFAGRYAHSTESQSFADYKLVVGWLENGGKPDLACDVNNVISDMRKASRTSALAKAFYDLSILNGSKDFFTGQEVKLDECQVDHVFPASKYPNGDKNIFNFAVIHKETNNRRKHAELPSEFIKSCLGSHGGDKAKLQATLRTHFISPEALKAMEENNLNNFTAARERCFQEALETRVLKR